MPPKQARTGGQRGAVARGRGTPALATSEQTSTRPAGPGAGRAREPEQVAESTTVGPGSAAALLVAEWAHNVHLLTPRLRARVAELLRGAFGPAWQQDASWSVENAPRAIEKYDFSQLAAVVEKAWDRALATQLAARTRDLAARVRRFRNELAHQSASLSEVRLRHGLQTLSSFAAEMGIPLDKSGLFTSSSVGHAVADGVPDGTARKAAPSVVQGCAALPSPRNLLAALAAPHLGPLLPAIALVSVPQLTPEAQPPTASHYHLLPPMIPL
jgi:hypothetical protein